MAHYWKETGKFPSWAHPKDAGLITRKLALHAVDREFWWDTSIGEHEVTFALSLIDGRCERYTGERDGTDAWKEGFNPREWLTGTIDYLVQWDDGAWIDDLKTGRPVYPKRNRQLLSYALMVWAHAGRPKKWRYEVSITHWPKYPLGGVPKRERSPATVLDLIAHEDDLRWAVAHPGEVNPGDKQCRFCDSMPDCSAGLRWSAERDN